MKINANTIILGVVALFGMFFGYKMIAGIGNQKSTYTGPASGLWGSNLGTTVNNRTGEVKGNDDWTSDVSSIVGDISDLIKSFSSKNG